MFLLDLLYFFHDLFDQAVENAAVAFFNIMSAITGIPWVL